MVISAHTVPLDGGLLNTEDHLPYIFGYPNGSVKAENNITRAETAVLFYRLLINQGTTAGNRFSDVPDGQWYSIQINYLASLGVLSGRPGGVFKPNDSITRAEFASIASKFDELSSTSRNIFKDVSIDHWAVRAINSVYAKGWISGNADGTFRPNDIIKRGEIAAIVNKMLDRSINAASLAKVKNPYKDMKPTHWAYADIIEASIAHEYTRGCDGTESWSSWY